MYSLRVMERGDWHEVADLIFLSTNTWYQTHGLSPVFRGLPSDALLFCQVYEDLDPGCGIVAEHKQSGRIIGSCFYHPRETHVSLGIMNVHPNYFGARIAGALLDAIIGFAQERNAPLRLVSSALNLDSFSLYTRKGFSPYATYQDMFLSVPKTGLSTEGLDVKSIRPASPDDISKMGALEFEISGISREQDYRYFIENKMGVWNVSIYQAPGSKEIEGFIVSINHPGSNMLGPGVARTSEVAAALIINELNHHKGRSPVFLVPVDQFDLVQRLYKLGARNCELHFAQVLGDAQLVSGIVMPTFMPESG